MTDAPSHYDTDERLAARQRLWAVSAREPAFDLYPWVLAVAGITGDERVLDLGCGNRAYERLLAARRHRGVVVALDLSLGMGPDVQADAQALPLADRSFDIVLAPHMLYHVPDVTQAAHEVRRVLRPGGAFVAVTNGRRTLRELVDLVEAAVGTGWRMLRPADVHFGIEEGAALLASAFASVDLVEAVGRVVVTDADALADYVWSVGDAYEEESGADWDAVVEHVRTAARAAIAVDGSIRLTAAVGAFVCR